MTYRVKQRLFHTADKGRLVADGDPEARYLAFPAGTELSDEEADRFGVAAFERKMATRSLDKMQRPPADKSASPVPSSDSTAELRAQAEQAGVKVDGRWSAAKLRTEIDKATKQ